MADVEVKLDIKAEAKAALAAVEALGKKLDELQAKSRLLVGGGGDESGGGSDGPGAGGSAAGAGAAGDVAVPVVDLSGQQAAVEGFRKALEAVRVQVAAVGAVLQELAGQPSVPTDGAAQVAALAEVYRQLAEAVGAVNEAVGAMPVPELPTVDAPTVGGGAPKDDGPGLIGEENYLEKLEEEKRAVEELREELRQLNAAHEEAGEAAGEATDDVEELAYQMELAQMNAQELAQEIERLTEARKASAKAGDAVAMQRYGKQLQLANKEMQRSRREQTIMRAAWLQQAQGAREAAQSIKNVVGGFSNLSENAKNGQLDLVGLGMEVFSLAKAFKGLLGPVGLALVALELVTSAWNEYQQRKQHGVELAQEKLKKDAEDLKKATEAYREAGKAYRDEKAKEYEEYNKNLLDNIRAEAELGEQRAERANQLLAAETAHREKMLRVQLQAAVGADKERLQEELKNIDIAKAARVMGDAEAAESAARYALTLMERELENSDKYKDLLAIKLPDVEELKQLEVRLESAMRGIGEALGEEEKAALRKQVASIRLEMRDVAATVRGVDENIHGSDREVVEWVRSLQEARRSSEKVVEEQRKTWEATKNEAELAKKNYDWRVEEAAAEKKATEARRAAEEAAAERALEWERLKEQPLAEQVRWLKAQARNTQLSAKEQERIRKELASVQARQISEAMAQLLQETQVTGTYQKADNRTRREIMRADAAMLTVRRRELESLLQTADLEPTLRKQLEAELRKTLEQMSGLSEAWGKNRQESYRWLSELQPPKLQARNERVQKNLDAMAQGYARAARNATEAARTGDAEGLRAARRSMLTYAKAMSRMSADSTASQRLYREHTEKLREVSRRTALSASEERKVAEAEKRKAAAQRKLAERAEKDAARSNQKQQGEQKEVQITALTNEVTQLRADLQGMSQAYQVLVQRVLEVAAAARQTAAVAAEGARAAQAALAGQKRELSELRRAVEMLKKL